MNFYFLRLRPNKAVNGIANAILRAWFHRRHTRPVYFDADGQQYVNDDDGTPIHGEWIYIDEPEIIEPSRST